MSAKRKNPPQYEIYAPKDVQIRSRLGGGILKERVVRDRSSGVVMRYSLAYINPSIFGGDNGRVLGYDNAHGISHRHYMGKVTPNSFSTYETLYEQFESEWQEIAIRFVNTEE